MTSEIFEETEEEKEERQRKARELNTLLYGVQYEWDEEGQCYREYWTDEGYDRFAKKVLRNPQLHMPNTVKVAKTYMKRKYPDNYYHPAGGIGWVFFVISIIMLFTTQPPAALWPFIVAVFCWLCYYSDKAAHYKAKSDKSERW